MLRLENISKSYGGNTLFDGLNWELLPGRRIGLVGANGAGKTTLFRIIEGALDPDDGRVLASNNATVGLLPQTVGELRGSTVLERVLDALPEYRQLEARMEAVRRQIVDCAEDPEAAAALSDELGELETRYLAMDGYQVLPRARSILSGMGFATADFDRPTEEFSGGWRMRIVLSGLLLKRPSVLLMDEPTNHLDLPSLQWLEGFLTSYEGTVVVISHDRYFLNRLVTEIAALEPDGFFVCPGDYDAYTEARELRIEMLDKRVLRDAREREKIEQFIERFRSKATKAKQVQSRVKQLEKRDSVSRSQGRRSMALTFPESERSGKDVLLLKNVAKSYGDNTVYSDLSLTITRGEHVALVGPNGQGKSTLLKLAASVIEPDAGSVSLGHKVETGYFAQHHVEGLDLGQTILGEMEARATTDTFPRCRSILGAFLFSGDDVKKRLSVLSGGEKHRVALATLLLRPSNLLLLDEPTNHLDMESREVLQEALAGYAGTVIFVSHDRHFINAVATRVLHVEGGVAQSYDGDFEYYQYRREQDLAAAAPAPEATAAGAKERRREERRRSAEQRKELQSATREVKKRLAAVEKKVAEYETEKDAVGAKLADVTFYTSAPGAEVAEATRRHSELEVRLNGLYEEWEEVGSELERIEARFADNSGG